MPKDPPPLSALAAFIAALFTVLAVGIDTIGAVAIIWLLFGVFWAWLQARGRI